MHACLVAFYAKATLGKGIPLSLAIGQAKDIATQDCSMDILAVVESSSVEQQEMGLDRSDFLHYCFHLSHFAFLAMGWGNCLFLRMVHTQKRNSIMNGAEGLAFGHL